VIGRRYGSCQMPGGSDACSRHPKPDGRRR